MIVIFCSFIPNLSFWILKWCRLYCYELFFYYFKFITQLFKVFCFTQGFMIFKHYVALSNTNGYSIIIKVIIILQ